MEGKEGWVPIVSPLEEGVVKETNEKKVTTHDEIEDVVETEEVKHFGDVNNEVCLNPLYIAVWL